MNITQVSNFLLRRHVLSWLLAASVVLFLASSVLWLHVVYASPERVFMGMLEQNFKTTSFDRTVSASSDEAKQTEIARIQLTGEAFSQTFITIDREGASTIEAETLSTLQADFVRYTAAGAGVPDGVEGVWSQQDEPGQLSQSLARQLLFGTYFPMANLQGEARREVVAFIHEYVVYAANYATVKKEVVDGRRVFTYEVQIQQQTYAQLLKILASHMGLTQYANGIDPESYAGAASIAVEVRVDVLSRRLLSVSYPAAPSLTETYSDYGLLQAPVTLPEGALSEAELQSRMSADTAQ